MIDFIILALVLGLIVGLINAFTPIPGQVKQLLVIAVVIYLLFVFLRLLGFDVLSIKGLR